MHTVKSDRIFLFHVLGDGYRRKKPRWNIDKHALSPMLLVLSFLVHSFQHLIKFVIIKLEMERKFSTHHQRNHNTKTFSFVTSFLILGYRTALDPTIVATILLSHLLY